jgi:hypothetical protein
MYLWRVKMMVLVHGSGLVVAEAARWLVVTVPLAVPPAVSLLGCLQRIGVWRLVLVMWYDPNVVCHFVLEGGQVCWGGVVTSMVALISNTWIMAVFSWIMAVFFGIVPCWMFMIWRFICDMWLMYW